MADILTQAGVPGALEMQMQQQAIDRQRKLAEAIQLQAMQSPQGQMVSGHYVAPSGMEYLAKIAQGLVSRSDQKDLDQKQIAIGKNQDDSLMKMVQALVGGQPQPNTPAMNAPQEPPAMGLGSGISGIGAKDILPGDAVGQAQLQAAPMAAQAPRQGGNPMFSNMDPAIVRAIVGTPGGIAKLGEMQIGSNLKNGEFTEKMKNYRAMGITNEEAAIAERAALKKAGMITLQPGDTNQDLATGINTVAPDFKLGITGGYDAAGRPVMSGIQGNEVLAQLEGQKAAATAGANAGFKTQTVQKPGGPVLMTDKQVVDEATGGAALPTNGAFPTVTPQVQAQRDAQAIDIARQEVAQARTPQDRAQAEQVLNAMVARQAAGQSVITGAAGQRAPQAGQGMPLQSQESQAFGSTVAKGAGEDLLKTRDKAKGAADDLYGINESRKAIASGAFLGSGADFKTDTAKAIKGWIGVDVDANKVTNSEYLRSTLGQRMLDNAKKLGVNPTDADAKRLDTIIGTIAKDPKALIKALDFQEEMNMRAIKQHNDSVTQAQKNGLQSPYDLTVQIPTFGKATQPSSNGGWSIKPIP